MPRLSRYATAMSALLALSAILYSLVPLSSACPSTMILISGYNSNQEACLSSIAFASSSKLVEFVAKNTRSPTFTVKSWEDPGIAFETISASLLFPPPNKICSTFFRVDEQPVRMKIN